MMKMMSTRFMMLAITGRDDGNNDAFPALGFSYDDKDSKSDENYRSKTTTRQDVGIGARKK